MNRVEQSLRFKQLMMFVAESADFGPVCDRKTTAYDYIQKQYGNAYVDNRRVAKAGSWFASVLRRQNSES